jgi:hypothetical protein
MQYIFLYFNYITNITGKKNHSTSKKKHPEVRKKTFISFSLSRDERMRQIFYTVQTDDCNLRYMPQGIVMHHYTFSQNINMR